MYKILDYLYMIPEDKRGHINLGMLVALFFASNPLVAVANVIVIGATKEIIDWYTKKGSPEWLDFVATLFGGAIGLIGYKAIQAII